MARMTRSDFQRLARQRAREARVLLARPTAPGSYYLSGYAVECALKASIASTTRANEFPDRKFANDCWVHNLDQLLSLSPLASDFALDRNADPTLATAWNVAKDWSEAKRYDDNVSLQEARDMYRAVKRLLRWFRPRW